MDETAKRLYQQLQTLFESYEQHMVLRLPSTVMIDRLRFVPGNPPSFYMTEYENRSTLIEVVLPLPTAEEDAPNPKCTHCPQPCAHGFTIIDQVLRLLDSWPDEEPEQYEAVIQSLSVAPWQRWMDKLDVAIQVMTAEESLVRPRLWWALDFEQKTIYPYLQSASKKGVWLRPKKISFETLQNESVVQQQDVGVWAWARLTKKRSKLGVSQMSAAETFTRGLEALVEHPYVMRYQEDSLSHLPDRWKVTKAELQLSVETINESLSVSLSLRGRQILPSEVNKKWSSGLSFVFVIENKREILVVAPNPKLLPLIQQWTDLAVPIPQEYKTQLMQRLSQITPFIQIEASDVIKRQRISPSYVVVFVLFAMPDQQGLVIDIFVQPSHGAPLLKPGMGREDVVYANEQRELVDVYRNLLKEKELVFDVFEKLLAHKNIEEPAWTYTIEGMSNAFSFLEKVQKQSDPGFAVRWAPKTKAWHVSHNIDKQSIRFNIQKKRDWFEIHGEVPIDRRRLELAVLIQSARRDQGYVSLGEGQFARIEDDLLQQLQTLSQFSVDDKLKNYSRSVVTEISRWQETSIAQTDEAWKMLNEQYVKSQKIEPQLPKDLVEVLRPYQKDGFAWLSRLATWQAGAVLADEMGLGKTLQAISVMRQRAHQGPQIVVAPTSVCFNWVRELKRFAPELQIVEYKSTKRSLEQVEGKTVFVTSYGIVQKDVLALEKVNFRTLIFDEAHYLKNPNTQRTRSIRRLRADWRLALTGTPIENHPGELWSLMECISPGMLGAWKQFKAEHMDKETRQQATGSATLAKKIKPYVLRRTKKEIGHQLPPRTEIIVDVVLSNRERALYDDVRLTAAAQIQDAEVVNQANYHLLVLAALTRLRQLACHPRMVYPKSRVSSSKLERFIEVIGRVLADDHRALIFSQFTKHLELVREALDAQEIPYIYLDGSTPEVKRAQLVDEFQQGSVPLFLLSIKAGGTGLNLTAADTVVHLDPWWNPAVEDQATDRVHRIGQTRSVTVIKLVTKGTIEEQIVGLHHEKREMFEEILSGTQQVAKLSTEELAALIRGESSME